MSHSRNSFDTTLEYTPYASDISELPTIAGVASERMPLPQVPDYLMAIRKERKLRAEYAERRKMAINYLSLEKRIQTETAYRQVFNRFNRDHVLEKSYQQCSVIAELRQKVKVHERAALLDLSNDLNPETTKPYRRSCAADFAEYFSNCLSNEKRSNLAHSLGLPPDQFCNGYDIAILIAHNKLPRRFELFMERFLVDNQFLNLYVECKLVVNSMIERMDVLICIPSCIFLLFRDQCNFGCPHDYSEQFEDFMSEQKSKIIKDDGFMRLQPHIEQFNSLYHTLAVDHNWQVPDDEVFYYLPKLQRFRRAWEHDKEVGKFFPTVFATKLLQLLEPRSGSLSIDYEQ